MSVLCSPLESCHWNRNDVWLGDQVAEYKHSRYCGFTLYEYMWILISKTYEYECGFEILQNYYLKILTIKREIYLTHLIVRSTIIYQG